MRNKKIEQKLNDYHVTQISKERMQETIVLANQELRKQKLMRVPSLLEVLRHQIQYISPVVWIAQIILLLFVSILLLKTELNSEQINSTVVIISACSPIIALIGIPELAKSFLYNMWEIEDSCRFNLQKVLSMRMIIIGAVDILVISILLGVSSLNYNGNIVDLILYMLVPFNLSSVLYFMIISHSKGKVTSYISMAICIFMSVVLVQISIQPRLYQEIATWVWGMLFLGSFTLLIGQVDKLLNTIKQQEELQWKLQ